MSAITGESSSDYTAPVCCDGQLRQVQTASDERAARDQRNILRTTEIHIKTYYIVYVMSSWWYR